TQPLEFLAGELYAFPERPPLSSHDLRSQGTEQISYSVVGRGTVLLVFGLFFAALFVAVIALGRKGTLEHAGWLGPILALAVAAVFIGVGKVRRDAIPPTVAVAQIIDALAGRDEVQA